MHESDTNGITNTQIGGNLHSTNWTGVTGGSGWHFDGRILYANNVTMRKPTLMARIRAAIK